MNRILTSSDVGILTGCAGYGQAPPYSPSMDQMPRNAPVLAKKFDKALVAREFLSLYESLTQNGAFAVRPRKECVSYKLEGPAPLEVKSGDGMAVTPHGRTRNMEQTTTKVPNVNDVLTPRAVVETDSWLPCGSIE